MDCRRNKGQGATRSQDTDSEYENVDPEESPRLAGDKRAKRIVLDVGGERFVTTLTTISRNPTTRLASLTEDDPAYDPQSNEYFFDRNPKLFPFILDFCRTGELHLPRDLCGPFIRSELHFWRIPEERISPCCWPTFSALEEDKHTLESLESIFSNRGVPGEKSQRMNGFNKWKYDLWLFLEFPDSSKGARIWAYIYIVLLVCSIGVICLESHPHFRILGGQSCDAIHSNTSKNMTGFGGFPMGILTEDNPKTLMYISTVPHPVLGGLDHVCTCIFTVEILLRFVSWPHKLRFFTSFFNVVDMLAILPMSAIVITQFVDPCFWTEKRFLHIYLVMSFICVFRAVRILKVVKHSRGLQIMYLAIKASLREILLLLLLIIIATLIFSTMIYYAEFSEVDNFNSIPVGFWWSIVTMTTVGYGDTIPRTGLGYLVGSMCALCGMLITGLPIPVIANSFQMYYNYAKLKAKFKVAKQSRSENSQCSKDSEGHSVVGRSCVNQKGCEQKVPGV